MAGKKKVIEAKRGRGQPTKLNSETQEKICNAIRAGNKLKGACAYAGIHYDTFRQWIIWGEQGKSTLYSDFSDAVKKAEADSEVALVAIWRRQTPNNWIACAELLARRFPEEWGRRQSIELDRLRADIAKVNSETALLQAKLAEVERNGGNTQAPITVNVLAWDDGRDDEPDE